MSRVLLTIARDGDGPVAHGDRVTFVVRADADRAIGAVRGDVSSRPGELALTITDRIFTGSAAGGLAVHTAERWAASFAGARTDGTAGVHDLFEVTADVGALPGHRAELRVDLAEVITTDGIPLPPTSAWLTITLTPAPLTIDPVSIADARVGVPFHAVLTASGGRGPVRWSSPGDTLPPGLDLDEDGRLHGTPTTFGTWECTVAAVEEVSTGQPERATATIVLRVQPTPLAILDTPLPPLAPGVPYRARLASRGGRPPIRWDVGNLPDGLELHDDVIEGTVGEVSRAYGTHGLRVIARDASEPEERVEIEMSLSLLPLVESVRIDVPGAQRVAVGRDLIVVPYRVTLEVRREQRIDHAAQERVRDSLRDRLTQAIVAALLEDAEESVRDALVDPRDKTAREQADQRAAARARRIRWLREALDQIASNRLPMGNDIQVLFDHEPLIEMAGAPALELRRTERPIRVDVPPGRPRTSLLWRAMGRFVTSALRERVGRAGAEDATGAKEAPPVRSTGRLSIDRLPVDRLADEPKRDLRAPIVLDLPRAGAAERAAIAGLAVTGLLSARAGWAKLVTAVAGVAAAAVIGRRLLLRDLEEHFERLDRIDREWEIVTDRTLEFPYLALGRLECTPGAHHLEVLWSPAWWPIALTEEERAALFSDVTIVVRFTPEHPDRWPRFAEASQFQCRTDGTTGSWSSPVVLAGSEVDLLVADARNEVQLIAARGDGTFAAPRPFAVCTDLGPTLLVARLDPIGRSSVVATQGRWVRTWLNDGMHGFAEHMVSVALGDATATALGSGDLDGDGWHEVLVGAGSEIGILDRLASSLRASGVPPHLLRTPVPVHVGNDALAAVVVSDAVALPPGRDETPPGYGHALVLARYGGEAILMRNEANGRLGAPLRLPGMDTPDSRRQPVGLVVDRSFGDVVTATAVTQRPAEAVVWRAPVGTAQPRARVRLPFVPAGAAPAPTRCGGVLVADRDGGRVFMLTRGLREELVAVPITFLGGQVQVAGNEGVAAAVGNGQIVVYR